MNFKEVLDRMMAWGQLHMQIKQVEWGKREELGSTLQYPLMFIQPIPGEISRHQNTDNFNIYFLDKMLAEHTNRKDVFNDMKLLCNDLVNYFDVEWFINNGFYIEEASQYSQIDGEENDIVGGIVFTIRCVSQYMIDCQAPLNGNLSVYVPGTGNAGSSFNANNYYTITQINNILLGYSLSSHTHALDYLSDVNVSGAVSGMVLKLSGSTWIAGFDNSGSTVDLSNYYNKQQVYNTGETYTQLEINNIISGITVDLSAYYTSAQTDANFLSANTSYYTQNQVNTGFLSANTSYVSPIQFGNHTGDTSIHFTLSSFQNNFLSANTSYYTQSQANSSFLSANTSIVSQSLFNTYTDITAPNQFVDVDGDTMSGNLNITPLGMNTETLVSVSSSTGQLNAYLITDQEFITNTDVITNILSGANWSYNTYNGSVIGLVEGQKYQCCNFLYVYYNSVMSRYKNDNPNITLYTATATASTNIDYVICSAATIMTLTLPEPKDLIYGYATIKNLASNVLLKTVSGLIDGETGQTLQKWESLTVVAYSNNYYIK